VSQLDLFHQRYTLVHLQTSEEREIAVDNIIEKSRKKKDGQKGTVLWRNTIIFAFTATMFARTRNNIKK
jgi:hypothetical protein